MCHMRRRRIHVSYEEEEATCVGTQSVCNLNPINVFL